MHDLKVYLLRQNNSKPIIKCILFESHRNARKNTKMFFAISKSKRCNFPTKSTSVHGNRPYVSLKSIKSACYEIGISHDQVDVIKWENYELKTIMIENDSAAR